jgi:hypothetical protein
MMMIGTGPTSIDQAVFKLGPFEELAGDHFLSHLLLYLGKYQQSADDQGTK